MIGAGFGLRQGRWKYVEALEESRQSLFDVLADPGEQHDVATENGARVAEMAATVATWRAGMPEHAGAPPPAGAADEVRRKLRALGYTD